MRARFRIDPVLGGTKTDAERKALANRRREYRLLGPAGSEVFQRVVYRAWHEIGSAATSNSAWTETITDGPAHRWGLDPRPAGEGRSWRREFRLQANCWPGRPCGLKSAAAASHGRGHSPSQYLVFWPEGTVTRYGPPSAEPETMQARSEPLSLPDGSYSVRFGARDGTGVTSRCRVMYQPSERFEMPAIRGTASTSDPRAR